MKRLVSSHVNTYDSALRLLQRWGFALGVRRDEDDQVVEWTADRDDERLVGTSPLELLGQVHLGSERRMLCPRSELRRLAWDIAAHLAQTPAPTLLRAGLESFGPHWDARRIPWIVWARALTGMPLRDHPLLARPWLAAVGPALRREDVEAAVRHSTTLASTEDGGRGMVAVAQLLFHPHQPLVASLRSPYEVEEALWTEPRAGAFGVPPRWFAGRVPRTH